MVATDGKTADDRSLSPDERKMIRRACRSLARKGLAEFHSALWSEDCKLGGSGYCVTGAGIGFMTGGQEKTINEINSDLC
jgi:hypothetical protein